MTKIDEALAAQATLLNNYSEIVSKLIKADSTHLAERDQALSEIKSLLAADEQTAASILAGAPGIKTLIDVAAASILPAAPSPDLAIAS
ncbi:MAG: hypothetical protein V7K27_19980 [Nostoc sp.]|uniref:hypothetical protein n=1 Tax=Nostoc sp. TaxID=1180 RepID=UPI002FF6798A